MAQIDIKRIERLEKHRNTIHGKVVATYTVFSSGENKYFQLDTYGKEKRKFPEIISQSLQFDRESARIIVELLRREFDLQRADKVMITIDLPPYASSLMGKADPNIRTSGGTLC